MEFSQNLFFLFALLLPLVCYADPTYKLCSQNMTENGIWLDNTVAVLKDIKARARYNGYAISVVGNGTEAIYGLAQCRGDIPSEVCTLCIDDAIEQLQKDCPESVSARILKDMCSIRYQTDNFLGSVDVSDIKGWANKQQAEDPAAFKDAVWPLLGWVTAGTTAARNKFGMGKRSFVNNGKEMIIYGMAQCTTDLQQYTCAQCLKNILAMMGTCADKVGCSVRCSSCRARFEIYDFLSAMVPGYFSSAPSPYPDVIAG